MYGNKTTCVYGWLFTCERLGSGTSRPPQEIARLEGVVSELQGSALSKEPAGELADDDADAIVVGSDTQQEQ